MKDLIEYIAKSIVSKPEEVEVIENVTDTEILVELIVNPDDLGKVIGKQGKIAKAIRNILKAISTKEGKNIQLKILEKE